MLGLDMHIGANIHPPSGRYQHTHKHQSEDRLAELSCIASSTSTLSLGAGSMHSKVGGSPSPKSLALQHGANFLCPVSLGNKNQAKSRGTVSHVKMVGLAHTGVNQCCPSSAGELTGNPFRGGEDHTWTGFSFSKVGRINSVKKMQFSLSCKNHKGFLLT